MFIWFVLFIILCVLVVYSVLIACFIIGWNKIKTFKDSGSLNEDIMLSCVIPFRNEKEHLYQLIENLQDQKSATYEIILIDDHSTDESYAVAKDLTSTLENFVLLQNTVGEGKKSALKQGVNIAKGEYIVFSDADCIHPTSWLSTIASFLNKNNTDLLLGPVKYFSPSSFFEKFQTIDFMSLIMSGAGAVGINKAIMCNGANLIVKKDVWQEAQNYLNDKYASGDDIFLLQYCKNKGKKIDFLKSSKATVETYCEKTLKGFFRQRARWASKSKGYTDWFTLFVAWVVFLSNVCLLTLPLCFFINYHCGITFFGLIAIKFIIDYLMLKIGAVFFSIKMSLGVYLAVAAIYPLYIVISVMLAVKGPTSWKGRKI